MRNPKSSPRFSHTCKQTLCWYLTHSGTLSTSLGTHVMVNKSKCFPILFAFARSLNLLSYSARLKLKAFERRGTNPPLNSI